MTDLDLTVTSGQVARFFNCEAKSIQYVEPAVSVSRDCVIFMNPYPCRTARAAGVTDA